MKGVLTTIEGTTFHKRNITKDGKFQDLRHHSVSEKEYNKYYWYPQNIKLW